MRIKLIVKQKDLLSADCNKHMYMWKLEDPKQIVQMFTKLKGKRNSSR